MDRASVFVQFVFLSFSAHPSGQTFLGLSIFLFSLFLDGCFSGLLSLFFRIRQLQESPFMELALVRLSDGHGKGGDVRLGLLFVSLFLLSYSILFYFIVLLSTCS